ncbi:MAG: cytosolic protein [bacterium]|jgi:hypothetical protein|nr:cytosolic protein [bacterium]
MQDQAWKEIIEKLFPDFLAFFFPKIYSDIDFSRGVEFLDKELQKILKGSELGKKIVDKLVKVYLNDGSEKWLLIHIEVQGYQEENFSERIYIYNYRIFDRYREEVISLALLTDINKNYRPTVFEVSRWGFKLSFQFPIIKLLDYQEKWKKLEQNLNPFGIVVMSFLKTIETKGNEQQRYSWKKHFLLGLYERGLTRDIIFILYQFIDLLMNLSDELEQELIEAIEAIEEAKKMSIITSAERIGIEKGKKEGMEKGKIEGLHESIYDIFEVKFGKNIYELFAQVKQIQDIEILQKIRVGLKKAQTLEETRNLILLQLSTLQKN